MNAEKEDNKSVGYRTSGNSYYRKETAEDYLRALKFYNRAICFAPIDSENLCFAYANRSAVYFKLFMFEECLENIELVRKIDKYPSHLWDKLSKQEAECRTIIAVDDPNKPDAWKEPELGFPPHSRVPYIADCLEMRQNDHFGSYLVATRDLKVGEIVAIVKPFCTTRAKRYQFERCENCSRDKFQNLIPCQSCTAVMFCDETCTKEAMDSFHQYECVVIDLRNLLIPLQQEQMTLRMIMCGLAIYQNIDKYLNMTEKALKNNVKLFDSDHNSKTVQYAVMLSMKKVSVSVIPSIETDVTNIVTICEKIFERREIISKKRPHEFKKTFWHIVEQHLRIVEMNGLLFDDLSYHIVNKRSPSYNDKDIDNNMSGLYPISPMFAHSCTPNVLSSSCGDRKILSIARPIKTGEQLFHSNAGTFFDTPKEIRQKSMPFKCQCVACTKNYPMLSSLPRGLIEIPDHINTAIVKSYKFDRKQSLANRQWVVDALQNNDQHMPCLELAILFKYYTTIMKVIYSSEVCIEMHVNPVEQVVDIAHGLRHVHAPTAAMILLIRMVEAYEVDNRIDSVCFYQFNFFCGCCIRARE